MYGTTTADIAPTLNTVYTVSSFNGVLYFLKAVFYIVVLMFLFYYVAKYLFPKTMSAASSKYIQVIDKKILEPQVALYLVKLGSKILLLGVSGKGVNLLVEYNDKLEPVVKPEQPTAHFSDLLKKIINKKEVKND